MGCTNRKELECPLKQEEEMILDYEQGFGLSNISVKELYKGIRTYSIEEIHMRDLENVLTQLGWSPKPFEDKSLLEKYLLEYCKVSEELINSKKVIMLGILLGRGSLESKAKILFDVCDLDVSGNVSKEELIWSFKTLVRIALREIPTLAEQSLDPKLKRQISKFRSIITKMEETIVQHMLENFITGEEEIDQSDFIIVIQQTKSKHLISSVALRNFTYLSYKQVREFDNTLLSLKSSNIRKLSISQLVEVMQKAEASSIPKKI